MEIHVPESCKTDDSTPGQIVDNGYLSSTPLCARSHPVIVGKSAKSNTAVQNNQSIKNINIEYHKASDLHDFSETFQLMVLYDFVSDVRKVQLHFHLRASVRIVFFTNFWRAI